MANETLRSVKLGTPKTISIKDCPNLEELTMQSPHNLESLTLHGQLGSVGSIKKACEILKMGGGNYGDS